MYHLQLCNVDISGQRVVVVGMSNAYVFAWTRSQKRIDRLGPPLSHHRRLNHLILENQLLTVGEVFAA